jgi:peroxiredoxin
MTMRSRPAGFVIWVVRSPLQRIISKIAGWREMKACWHAMKFSTIALLAGVVLWLGGVTVAAAIDVGKAAPPAEARLLDGTRFALREHAGEVVILNFWATWCEPCRAEMPAIEAYYQQHRAEGLQIIAVSMDDPKDEAKVREVMRAFSFPAALMRDASLKGYGRIWRIPLTFVIDRQGIVRKDGWYGEAGIDLPLLEKTVTPLLLEFAR